MSDGRAASVGSRRSDPASAVAGTAADGWLARLLGVERLVDGDALVCHGHRLVVRDGIARVEGLLSDKQKQTKDVFSFLWGDAERFSSPESQRKLADWYRTNYGAVAEAGWWNDYVDPILLEAGCGKGLSGSLTFGNRLHQVRYLGVDISDAVDAARRRFSELGLPGQFLQANLLDLPIPDASVDVIYSQGVLHHTDSTAAAIAALSRKLRPGGRFLFYVYRRKGPVREFVDDHVRQELAGMSPREAWDAMMALTQLGKALGELDVDIEIPEDVDLLEIPKGRMKLQRLFYWHVAKAFHDPDLSIEELNQINFDWYAPANAWRHTVEEIRQWCADAGLTVEREHVQPSGLSYIARKAAPAARGAA